MANEDHKTCLKAVQLVLDVLGIAASDKTYSEHNLALENSNDIESSNHINAAGRNLQENTNGSMEKYDPDADLIPRKRNCQDFDINSHNSAEIKDLEKIQKHRIEDIGTNRQEKMGISTDLNEDPVQEQSDSFVNNAIVNGEAKSEGNFANRNEKATTHQTSCSFNNMMPDLKGRNETRISVTEKQDVATSFAGFNNNSTEKEKMSDTDIKADKDLDGGTLQQIKEQTRAEYLEEASKKYYFREKGCPSFRLFDWHDDNGKEIEEKELWRPVNSQEQEQLIEEPEKHENFIDQQPNQERDVIKEVETPSNKEVCEQSEYETIVQCAQQPPKILSKSIYTVGVCTGQQAFDFSKQTQDYQVNGCPNMGRTDDTTHNQSDFMLSNNPFEKSPIVGRKLFDLDESDEQNNSQRCDIKDKQPMSPEVQFLGEKYCIDKGQVLAMKQMSPEVQFLGEKSWRDEGNVLSMKQRSPEIQILGEKSFNQQRKDLALEAENYYNTKLSLGSTTSVSGKENIVPRRFMNPSKYVSSPYNIHDIRIITDHEEKLYEAMTTLCEIKEY